MNGAPSRNMNHHKVFASEFEELQDSLMDMKVQRRSQRLAQTQALPSKDTLTEDDEEEDDETFDPAVEGDDESSVTETFEEEDEEDYENESEGNEESGATSRAMEAIPEEAVQIGDGASDFFPSDCEDDEEVVTHTRLNRHSAQKYYERGSRAFHSILGTSGTTQVQPPHWISTLHKYSVEERRWVNKGPVLLYFVQFGTRIRLVANYLYGIKSIALNMEIREKSESVYNSFSARDLFFSSFGYNIFTQADIISDVVPLSHFYNAGSSEHLPVSRCFTQLKSTPEESASVFCLKFLTQQVRGEFMNSLSLLIRWTAFARSKDRYTTFKEPQYIHDERHYHVLHQNLPPRSCPSISEEELIGYASSGYHYAPFFSSATQTVQDRIYCLDCGAQTCNPLTRDQLMALHHPRCWMVKPGVVDMSMAQLEPGHYCVVRS